MAHSRGLLFIATAAVSWGVGGFVAAILYDTSGLGPIAVTFWRYLGGIALLAALRRAHKKSNSVKWGIRIANGLGMALYQTAYFVAIDLAGVAIATVVVLGSGPVLVAIGAKVFLREGLSVGATAVSLTGLVLLVGTGQNTGERPLLGLGLAVALVSAAGYAGVTLLNRAVADDPYDAALSGFAVGIMALLPPALFEGLTPTGGDLRVTVALLLFLGAVPTALAYALFFAGLRVVRATTASIVTLIEPVAAVALGVLILHEPLSIPSAAGAILLLGAVVALVRTS